MNVIFKASFIKDLRKVKDPTLRRQVKGFIESIEQATSLQEITNLKQLKGVKSYYRVRVGNYRIGLRIENETIVFVRFLHRKDIYRYFP